VGVQPEDEKLQIKQTGRHTDYFTTSNYILFFVIVLKLKIYKRQSQKILFTEHF